MFYQQRGEMQGGRQREDPAAWGREATCDGRLVISRRAYADFLASQSLVRRMEERTLLETARQAKDDVKLLYEKGGARLGRLPRWRWRHYISTNVECLNDVASYWTSVFRLEHTGLERSCDDSRAVVRRVASRALVRAAR